MSKLLLAMLFVPLPLYGSPQDQMPEPPQEEQTTPNRPLGDDFSIATPPPLAEPPPPASPHYYPYRQQLTFRAGAAWLFPTEKSETKVVGFQYIFPKFLSPKLEAGADLQNGGYGHIYVGARWIFWERSYFRPSYKIALDHFVDATEGMATLTHIQNYGVRVGGALEYVVWIPYSLRLEADLIANFNNVNDEVTLGLSRGW